MKRYPYKLFNCTSKITIDLKSSIIDWSTLIYEQFLFEDADWSHDFKDITVNYKIKNIL